MRLNTAGSASTCPKSGFTVASSVRFDATRYLRSAPTVPKEARPKPPSEVVEAFRARKYGAASIRFGAASPSSPDTSPSCETRPAFAGLNIGQLTRSLKRQMSRSITIPKVCCGAVP